MFRKITTGFCLILLSGSAGAQAPDIVPYGKPDPIEFDLFNIILLIVLPVLLFVAYFLYQRKKKKQKRREEKKF
jgi:heme/copper-type cytochrome/quinol oxidase subunit 2